MRALLCGRSDRPAVAAIGVWDPLLPGQRRLLGRMGEYARAQALSSVAILIDPPPALYLHGPSACLVCNDVRARVHLLRDCGIDAVLLIRFTRGDLEAGATDLFAVIQSRATLAELWLGTGQSLGRGPKGNYDAIAALAAQRGMRLAILPPLPLGTASLRQALAAGRFREAAQLLGRPLVRSRPKGGMLQLPWRPGRYLAVALDHPCAPTDAGATAIYLTADGDGLSSCRWPDPAAAYYAFVWGPGDDGEGQAARADAAQRLLGAPSGALAPSVPGRRW